MIIVKDETKLDPHFPFMIFNQKLKREDNAEDSFHWHNFCEITCVVKGKGNYFVNGQEYDMSEGDLIIFNNVELHGWSVIDETMELIVMIFPTEFVSAPVTMFDYDYLRPFLDRDGNFKNRIGAGEQYASDMAGIMKDIMREMKEKNVGYRLMVKAQVLRILTLLIRCYRKSDTAGDDAVSGDRRSMKRLEEAFYYINSHYTEKMTLEEVASSVYMSPNYFSTYFKGVTSLSFSDYVTVLRLNKAKEMIKTTDMNMADIAEACGFHNMSNFYRLYKKHIGNIEEERKNR